MKPPIFLEIYESRRLLKWSWRFRFVASNGQKLGHQYNDLATALKYGKVIFERDQPVQVRIIYRDGRIDNRGSAK